MKLTRYDWKDRGWILRPMDSKQIRHEVVLIRKQTLCEMYKAGYLTGQAEKDAGVSLYGKTSGCDPGDDRFKSGTPDHGTERILK